MATLTGNLLNGNGTGLVGTAVTFTRIGKPGASGASVLSTDTVSATTTTGGALSVTLTAGTWQMRWYTDEGLASDLILGIPAGSSSYTVGDVAVDTDEPPVQATTVWYDDISGMLAADARTWITGRTLNSYGTDGVRTGWDCVLKTTPAAAGMADNGDSILETDDELGFAVRTWVAL